MDENAISVQCKIEGCNARVHGDVKCREHGGDPIYQWRHSDWGDTSYRVRGGPVEPGYRYTVGEAGPEWVTFKGGANESITR